jgi:hypothetical protein
MGGASGSGLAEELWEKIKPLVTPKNREKVAFEIYEAFSNADADDWDPDSDLIVTGKVAEKEGWDEDYE